MSLTSLGSSVKSIQSLNTNCYEMEIHRKDRQVETSQHKEITNSHLTTLSVHKKSVT